MAAVGVGSGNSASSYGDGAPAPITAFSADGGFATLDMTQFYAQTDPAYVGGGSILTMYAEVPAGSSVQSHVITNNGMPNTAPSALYCFKEGPGTVASVPWFTGNSCSGTASCTISSVAAGHMLVISAHTFGKLPYNPITITDTQPETVTFDQVSGSTGLGTWHIAPIVNGGDYTITVNDSADPDLLVNVAEIAGQASGNPVEAIGQNSFNSSPLAFADLTTSTPNDLLYGWGRSYYGSDEGQGFTSIRVAPTAEYAVAPAAGSQPVLLYPRGTPPWAITGVQAMAIRPAGSSTPPTTAPQFTGNYCVASNGGTCTIDNVSAGDLLVISSWLTFNQVATVADTQSETIVLDRSNDNDGVNVYLSTWHIAAVTNAGNHTISANPAVMVVVTEYTGQSEITNPIDAVAAATGTTGGSASVSVQTSQGNDLIYAWCGTDSTTGWGDGFAAITVSPSSEFRMAASTPGTETATCSSSDSSAGWVVQELAIKH